LETLFVLRLNQQAKERPATIYCRITVNGLRSGDFSTFIKVLPQHWERKAQLITSGTEEADQDNERLRQIRTTLKTIFNRLCQERENVTAYLVKEEFLSQAKPEKTLLEVFQEFVDRQHKLVSRGKVALNTMKGYRSRLNILREYLTSHKKEGLVCDLVTNKFAHAYTLHLKTKEDPCGQNAAMKHVRGISQVLDYAVQQEYIKANPLLSFPYEFEKSAEPTPLNLKEIRLLESHKFNSDSLQQVTDSFIFKCYTGFAYVDYASFNPKEDLQEGVDGIWIAKNRIKTDEKALLPLFDKARQLLEKYGNKMPVISNQKENKYLKEVGEIVGIKKKLTTKVARQTAAQVWLDSGVSVETVARMLGHSTRMTLKHYGRISQLRIASETKKLDE
jgi:site-specific recombinase XerD